MKKHKNITDIKSSDQRERGVSKAQLLTVMVSIIGVNLTLDVFHPQNGGLDSWRLVQVLLTAVFAGGLGLVLGQLFFPDDAHLSLWQIGWRLAVQYVLVLMVATAYPLLFGSLAWWDTAGMLRHIGRVSGIFVLILVLNYLHYLMVSRRINQKIRDRKQQK